ncbi:MAG: chromosome partitioning protein ParB, partial [Thermus sp.]|nr:chromosome partitioning protein ParB [Thermus sp.]
LPLLNLPEDLKEALLEGSIPYTAALELKMVKDPSLRQALLSEAKAGLPLRELKARVRESLKRPSPPTPYRELLRRLARLDLEGLPPGARDEVEELLRVLAEKLGIQVN